MRRGEGVVSGIAFELLLLVDFNLFVAAAAVDDKWMLDKIEARLNVVNCSAYLAETRRG